MQNLWIASFSASTQKSAFSVFEMHKPGPCG